MPATSTTGTVSDTESEEELPWEAPFPLLGGRINTPHPYVVFPLSSLCKNSKIFKINGMR
jgi:hypothetical protein